MIRNDKDINGINIGETEFKISQYAYDAYDATVFVSNLESIKKSFRLFEKFEKSAGLKLNITKTKGIWLGTLKDTGYRLYNRIHFNW